MPKVVAWRCDQTDKLFYTQDEYRKHLRKLSRERMKQRAALKAEREYEDRIHDYRMACQSIDDIARWAEANIPLIYTKINPGRRATTREPIPTITEVRFENMHWDPHCSCSHSAPVGRRTVWSSTNNPENHPTSHPGWRGRFSYTTTDYMNWDSSAWTRAGICTGSGGGGLKSSYDVTIWAEDFPLITVNAILRDKINLRDAPYPAVRRALRLLGQSGKIVGEP